MVSAGYQVIKRKKNGRELGPYQVRVFVPKGLQARVGRAEVWRTLSTTDHRLAIRLAPAKVVEIEAEWDVPGESLSSPAIDPLATAVGVGFDKMLAAMEEHRKAWPADDAGYAAQLANREASLRRYVRSFQDGDLSKWEAVADRALEKRGLELDKGSDEYAAFVQAVAESSIDAIGVFTRRVGGELDAEPRSQVVREAKARQAAKAKPGETIMELFERMASEGLEKDALRPDTVNQNRKVLQLFAEFVGKDRAIDSITPQEVCEFRDARRDVPPKWSMKRELRGLSLREAAAKARGLNLPKTAFMTVNRELSTISPLYAWLARQPRWAGLRNPCDGLFYQGVKGKNPRPPYETAGLNKILGSPLFTGFLANDEEHQPGDMHADDWRKWIPLVAMFTGARAGEIAQLRVCDVRTEHGTWFIHLIEDAKAGLTVKNRERRVAPVHSKLETLGFIAFVERRREVAGDDAPLFPELVKNEREQIGAEPSAWWRDYLTRIGVKDASTAGGDGFGLHSFRHELTDRLRTEAELLNNEIAVCLGHSIKSTTSGYGRVPQGTAKMMKEWIEAVKWEGVNFSPTIMAKSR